MKWPILVAALGRVVAQRPGLDGLAAMVVGLCYLGGVVAGGLLGALFLSVALSCVVAPPAVGLCLTVRGILGL